MSFWTISEDIIVGIAYLNTVNIIKGKRSKGCVLACGSGSDDAAGRDLATWESNARFVDLGVVILIIDTKVVGAGDLNRCAGCSSRDREGGGEASKAGGEGD